MSCVLGKHFLSVHGLFFSFSCFFKEGRMFKAICLGVDGQELLLRSCLHLFFHTPSVRSLVVSVGFLDTDEEFWERRVGLP